MTYYGAKGLEWPLVVLTDLDKGPNGRTFGLSASTLGVAAQAAGRREALRLLYVGATRARDYLVLVDGGRGLPWLDELLGADGRPHVRLGVDRVEVGDAAFPARGLELDDEEEVVAAPAATVYVAPAAESVAYPPRSVRPSEERAAEVPPILETVRLGERIGLPGSPDLQALDEALHGLLAADDPSAPRAEVEPVELVEGDVGHVDAEVEHEFAARLEPEVLGVDQRAVHVEQDGVEGVEGAGGAGHGRGRPERRRACRSSARAVSHVWRPRGR